MARRIAPRVAPPRCVPILERGLAPSRWLAQAQARSRRGVSDFAAARTIASRSLSMDRSRPVELRRLAPKSCGGGGKRRWRCGLASSVAIGSAATISGETSSSRKECTKRGVGAVLQAAAAPDTAANLRARRPGRTRAQAAAARQPRKAPRPCRADAEIRNASRPALCRHAPHGGDRVGVVRRELRKDRTAGAQSDRARRRGSARRWRLWW